MARDGRYLYSKAIGYEECILLTLLSCTIVVSSQKSAGKNQNAYWKSGCVILNSGDTLHGNIKIQRIYLGYDSQKELEFIFKSGFDTLFSTAEVSAYFYYDTIEAKDQIVSFVSLENSLRNFDNNWVKPKKYFFHLVDNGKCKIYGCTGFFNPNGYAAVLMGDVIGAIVSEVTAKEEYCIQRGGSDLYPIILDSFKKDMSGFFWNCPQILQRIKTKVYTYDNWKFMVQDFNSKGCF